jgi:hypothetical protein
VRRRKPKVTEATARTTEVELTSEFNVELEDEADDLEPRRTPRARQRHDSYSRRHGRQHQAAQAQAQGDRTRRRRRLRAASRTIRVPFQKRVGLVSGDQS